MGSYSISVVDLERRAVASEIEELDGSPSHCRVDESNQQLVVTCQGGSSGSSVQVFDLETEDLIAKIVDTVIDAQIAISSTF
ncbi:MAG: hypothetical protein ACXV2F_00050 [Halobacteriota archaeon]